MKSNQDLQEYFNLILDIQDFKDYISRGRTELCLNGVKLIFKKYGKIVDDDYVEFYATVHGILMLEDNDFEEGEEFYGGIWRVADNWKCKTGFYNDDDPQGVIELTFT